MKALFIGGTGTISSAITRLLLEQGCELYLLNRGTRNEGLPAYVNILQADINDEEHVSQLIQNLNFDVVADFIAFHPAQLERDYRLFQGKTKQFMFISSASAYQKPLADYQITESTPLSNPYWEYSRNKIACEEYLMKQYRNNGFPITIVRPSHTYDDRSIPLGVHGKNGTWQVVRRMLDNKPVIIHGDGTSLWTMTHNSDFAKGFIGLMGNIHAIGESVNITSDETLTWNQIYAAIADALGVELRAVHVSSEFLAACSTEDYRGALIGDKANSIVFDNSKLKRLVPNFVATTRFDQGIKQTLKYVLEHPEFQKEDKEFDMWCDKVILALERAAASVRE
ncbi:SDR family oxidoreductase [Bacillus sp. ISL-40]|uniref:SDR family oxidoreductase n=1 Tax=unclassified Bacillus (in: firmicutes) TaxID=185979 RepID=UPI001BE73ADC|nr:MULTISPECIES: SDR family oxidoreductase [unclassified Bacillus (in: firmicutes)]MBT2698620.1 SDR family oxidoreductase [Bacillus sp. ISL-40]MBT2720253.1 SDR family oxidoreductase [Bacillus sp. ISL-46]MBT2739153.1 SDR family oxidoreductase [Bacillus sp. ISL-77]